MDDIIISPQELKTLLKEAEVTLIDIRTKQEHELYNIGGIVISLADLPLLLKDFDQNKMIVIYCHAGVRSLMAAKLFIDAGFKSVKSLAGGILAWQEMEEEISV